MIVIETNDELHEQLREWRHDGEHVGLVPTMGNLHSGHASLVDIAREHAERVVVSVFVNPTQFGEDEDFDEYPRTLERDTRRLKQNRADILFSPSVETVYPYGIEQATLVTVPYLTDNFCGSFRPGHFDGVTSVVARLFAIVRPDVAVFGQKDYQQQLVIQRMAADLSLPIKVIVAPTVREDDGLAMSSRNSYLTAEERAVAPTFHATLDAIGQQLQSGNHDYAALEAEATAVLERHGFRIDYVAIRRADDLSELDQGCDEIVVLAAVHLGGTRLIDNVVVSV